jgi:NAD(P)-dependent dehydrogenase (short-subunit alcohol dehydrogenase family)
MPDKSALVVGGTRRVGRWVSEALLVADYAVASTYYKDAESAVAFQREMQAAGHKHATFQLDATDALAARNAVDEAASGFGQLDLLAVCCGPSISGSIIATSPEEVERVWRANVLAAHNCIVAAAPYLRLSHGRIVCFLSAGTDSVRAFSEIPVYAAAKTMLAGYLRSLAREFADSGVTVNAIALGLTELPAEGAPGADAKGIGTKRQVTQEDVAAAVWYLAGPAAGRVTGTVINLGAGFGL